MLGEGSRDKKFGVAKERLANKIPQPQEITTLPAIIIIISLQTNLALVTIKPWGSLMIVFHLMI
jgi:hypothetical protein